MYTSLSAHPTAPRPAVVSRRPRIPRWNSMTVTRWNHQNTAHGPRPVSSSSPYRLEPARRHPTEWRCGSAPPEVSSQLGMVATGSPEATQAAVGILEQGGNAVDAAVAAALVLGVSDSDASGLGGMTYMVIRLAGGHAVAIDGTARAPGVLDLEALRAAKMEDREFGYETVAVPTTLAVLQLALDTYGTISMAEALQPAIEVATLGYRLSPIQIAWTRAYHEELVVASDYLRFLVMEDGTTIGEPGEIFCNHDLAGTLREIARHGVDSFYRGSIAARIEADMVKNGGFVRRGDLAMVRVRRVPPMTTTYRGVEVLTVPPPGGGDSLVGALDILETFPAAFLAEDSPRPVTTSSSKAPASVSAAARSRAPAPWWRAVCRRPRGSARRGHRFSRR